MTAPRSALRRKTVSHVSSWVPARRPGNFHLLAQMKVTKAKCLNTHLAKQLLGKSSRFTGTERAEAFPLGVARRFAALYSWWLEIAAVDSEQSRPSAIRSSAFKRTARPPRSLSNRWMDERLPASEVAKRRRVREETGRWPRFRKGRSSLQPSTSHECVFQALCFGDFHLGSQMKVTRPPRRNPAPLKVIRP